MRDSNTASYPPPDVVSYSQRSPHSNQLPRTSQSSPCPPPDVSNPVLLTSARNHRSQSTDPISRDLQSTAPPPEPVPPRADFLIIGLFALRLTQRMLDYLPHYPQRGADLTWLRYFLSHYDPAYDLAKISGGPKRDYLDMYPQVVSRMKRQDKFRVRFMSINPTLRERGIELGMRRMSDDDRKEMIDFVDAAREWGSTVPLPRDEAEGILKIADQRLVADLEVGRGGVDVRRRREDPTMARGEPTQTVL